jgi:hypothetical protein
MDQQFLTFIEFLEQRASDQGDSFATMPLGARRGQSRTGSVTDAPWVDFRSAHGSQVDERLFPRGMFKAVNPSRPVSPLNSRDLGSPHRKRFKSQVIGR